QDAAPAGQAPALAGRVSLLLPRPSNRAPLRTRDAAADRRFARPVARRLGWRCGQLPGVRLRHRRPVPGGRDPRRGAACQGGRGRGSIGILVNNAAVMLDVERPFKPFWEIGVDEWDRVMAVNARSVFLCCARARPLMVESGGGSVINITSDAIWHGYEGQLAYFASK